MLSVPVGWYVSQKKPPTFCVLTTGFPNVDLQIVVIKLFLNTCGSKLGRGEKQITPCQQGFSIGWTRELHEWSKTFVEQRVACCENIILVPMARRFVFTCRSRGLRYKLSLEALGTRIPGHSFKPRPNRCVLSTAGSVMTIGLSINRCEHSKNPVLREKTRLTSLGCGPSSSIKNTKESRVTKLRV